MKRNEAQQAAHDRLMEDVVRVVQEKRKGTELTYVTEEDFFVARVIGKFSDSGGDDVFDSFFRVFQRMGEGVSREIATFMTVFEAHDLIEYLVDKDAIRGGVKYEDRTDE